MPAAGTRARRFKVLRRGWLEMGNLSKSPISCESGCDGRPLDGGARLDLSNDFADRASGAVYGDVQHSLDPLIEARLTDIVLRLRSAWVGGVAHFWGEIHPIRMEPIGDAEKRIAATLCQGFFEFSQFLAAFEVFLLQAHQLGVVSEQAVLGLEKLVVDLRHSRCNLVEVSDTQCCLPNIFGGVDGCGGNGNVGVIHD